MRTWLRLILIPITVYGLLALQVPATSFSSASFRAGENARDKDQPRAVGITRRGLPVAVQALTLQTNSA